MEREGDDFTGSVSERVERLESVVCSLEEALALTRRDLMYASQRHRAEMDELQGQLRSLQSNTTTLQTMPDQTGYDLYEQTNGFGDGYTGLDASWSGPPPYTPSPPSGPPPSAPTVEDNDPNWEPLTNVVDENEVRRERHKWDGKYDEWDKDWKDWKSSGAGGGGKWGRDGDRWGRGGKGERFDYGKDGKGKGKSDADWKDYRREKKEERAGKGKDKDKGGKSGKKGGDDDEKGRRRRWVDNGSDEAGAFDDDGSDKGEGKSKNYGDRELSTCISFQQNHVVIDLSGWGLGDEGIGRWVEWALGRTWDRPVDELRLDHNKLTDAGLAQILPWCEKVPCGKFKLHANSLGDGAVAILIKVIEFGKDPNKPAKKKAKAEGDDAADEAEGDDKSEEDVKLRPDGGLPRSPVRELHLSHNQIGMAAAKDLVQTALDSGLYPYSKGKAAIPLWCRMEKNAFAEFPALEGVCVVDPSLGKRRTCSPYNCKYNKAIHVVSFCR